MTRKSPKQHRVKSHIREKRPVRSYIRGKGRKTQLSLTAKQKITIREKQLAEDITAGAMALGRPIHIQTIQDQYAPGWSRKHLEQALKKLVAEGELEVKTDRYGEKWYG